MLELKHAEEKLAEYEKKSAELFSALKEAYHLGDENPEEIKIGNVYDSDGDEVVFEWGERRDIEYVDDMVALQRAFVMLLGSASGAGKACGGAAAHQGRASDGSIAQDGIRCRAAPVP